MHDPLRMSRRARRECEIDHVVRRFAVGGNRTSGEFRQSQTVAFWRRSLGSKRRDAIDLLQMRQISDHLDDVVLVTVRAKTCLNKESAAGGSFQQVDDIGAGIVAMKGRVAHIAHSGTSQHDRGCGGSAGEPDRNALPFSQSGVMQISSQPVDCVQQIAITQLGVCILESNSVRLQLCPMAQARIHRFAAPIALLVELPGLGDIQKRQMSAQV